MRERDEEREGEKGRERDRALRSIPNSFSLSW